MITYGEEDEDLSKDHKNVLIITLGCSKNLVDAECMMTILAEDGYILTDQIEEADAIVVNTCGFIESAKKEAIDTILSAAYYKRPSGQASFLIVTGCLSQRYPGDILADLPEVDAVLGTAHYGDIASCLDRLFAGDHLSAITFVDRAGTLDHLREDRMVTTKTYAWLKIAEGCSNRCAYCAIPMIRGDFISREMEAVVSEAALLARQGKREIILTAQDTTRYGLDLYGRRMLPELIRRITAIEEVANVRIMYAYSDGITDELIREMETNPKLLHYLDMPIQHGSDAVLVRMNRRDTEESITALLDTLRSRIPDIVLRTTILVGFPGEVLSDMNRLIRNLKRWRFDRLGCFVFSPEEGTPAYTMPNPVLNKTANRRLDRVMRLQQEISLERNEERVGKTVIVTIESISDDGIFYMGRSFGEAPEVDPMIYVIAQDTIPAMYETYPVRLVEASPYDLTGVIENL